MAQPGLSIIPASSLASTGGVTSCQEGLRHGSSTLGKTVLAGLVRCHDPAIGPGHKVDVIKNPRRRRLALRVRLGAAPRAKTASAGLRPKRRGSGQRQRLYLKSRRGALVAGRPYQPVVRRGQLTHSQTWLVAVQAKVPAVLASAP